MLGTICCAIAALGYTGAHICLRKLAIECDPAWVTCVKAAVSMVVIGPWILYRWGVGRSMALSRRALISLILAGLLGQFCGNLSIQFALRIVGLAVTVPIVFGTLLVSSALMGRIVLSERIFAPLGGCHRRVDRVGGAVGLGRRHGESVRRARVAHPRPARRSGGRGRVSGGFFLRDTVGCHSGGRVGGHLAGGRRVHHHDGRAQQP